MAWTGSASTTLKWIGSVARYAYRDVQRRVQLTRGHPNLLRLRRVIRRYGLRRAKVLDG